MELDRELLAELDANGSERLLNDRDLTLEPDREILSIPMPEPVPVLLAGIAFTEAAVAEEDEDDGGYPGYHRVIVQICLIQDTSGS